MLACFTAHLIDVARQLEAWKGLGRPGRQISPARAMTKIAGHSRRVLEDEVDRLAEVAGLVCGRGRLLGNCGHNTA